MLQNAGILYRRERDLNEAHRLFTRARDIDPGFCDVWYWIGINAINLGNNDYHSINNDYQSINKDYQSINNDYQSINKDYQSINNDYQSINNESLQSMRSI